METGSRAAAEAPLDRLLQEEVRSLLPGAACNPNPSPSPNPNQVRSLLPGAAELGERAELSRQVGRYGGDMGKIWGR